MGMVSRLGLVVLNTSSTSCFRRPGYKETTIDVSLANEHLAARLTERGTHYSCPVCLLATLDVRNAFNSVTWDKALYALERDFRVLQYLLCIVENYPRDRTLVYDTDEGPKRKEPTSGAAQGSMLGPDVWNNLSG